MRFNKTLWAVQGLLAAVFLFAGVAKLVLPPEALAGPVAFPIAFLRFIGAAEVLGAVGLIVPLALRLLPGLTAVAAAGLLIIMIGATVASLPLGAGAALAPFAVGVLAALVVLGRWPLVSEVA
jgi:hypothetical protein